MKSVAGETPPNKYSELVLIMPDRKSVELPETEPGPSDRRIGIAGARRMLGLIGNNYDDEEIQEVLDCLYGIAEEGYEIYRDSFGPE